MKSEEFAKGKCIWAKLKVPTEEMDHLEHGKMERVKEYVSDRGTGRGEGLDRQSSVWILKRWRVFCHDHPLGGSSRAGMKHQTTDRWMDVKGQLQRETLKKSAWDIFQANLTKANLQEGNIRTLLLGLCYLFKEQDFVGTSVYILLLLGCLLEKKKIKHTSNMQNQNLQ